MKTKKTSLEENRLALQAELDRAKTARERNELGQFATPTALADDILSYARTLLPKKAPVRFLDPAFGTGSFFSALLKNFPKSSIAEAAGYEIDRHYGDPALRLWGETALSLKLADFTKQKPDARYNLLICNPPYVRHHHIDQQDKLRLQSSAAKACGVGIAGLSGLYCYFLGLSHAWLAQGAISGWLIPSEFMDVNYGRAIKRYLLERVTLLRIHRFDPNDVQFADALVSSAVVWFRNEPPPRDHSVAFTFGGPLAKPHVSREVPVTALASEAKWTRFPAANVRARSTVPTLGDFFRVKRGLATGDNSYFILDEEEVKARGLPSHCLRPILPSPRHVQGDEIKADEAGIPLLERRLFLLDPRISEDAIRQEFPALFAYLEEGRSRGLHERYLCRHRSLWYSQEDRPAAPIVCTYMGRGDTKTGRPFRFILNHSRATVANVYLAMYPTPAFAQTLSRSPHLIRRAWEVLNKIEPAQLLGEGRVYGGGLHKLEPKELANVPVQELADLLPASPTRAAQTDLFAQAAE